MPAYLLDTNHMGMAVDRASVVGQRIFEARLAGVRRGMCLPVLCEIEAGMRQVRRKVKYRRNLTHLLLQLRLWPIDLKTARIYGELYVELRRRGRVVGEATVSRWETGAEIQQRAMDRFVRVCLASPAAGELLRSDFRASARGGVTYDAPASR